MALDALIARYQHLSQAAMILLEALKSRPESTGFSVANMPHFPSVILTHEQQDANKPDTTRNRVEPVNLTWPTSEPASWLILSSERLFLSPIGTKKMGDKQQKTLWKTFKATDWRRAEGVKGRESLCGKVKRYRSGSYGGVSHPITSVPLVKPDKDSSALWETGREEDSLW